MTKHAFEKQGKYKDLKMAIEKLWHLKPKTVTAIVGTLGLIKKKLKNKSTK